MPWGIWIGDHEAECEPGNSYYTSMGTKDSWIYTCRATIARKYIVASVTIVRITAENLSVLISRYAHQAMTRNADNSTVRSMISDPRDHTTHQTQYRWHWEPT